MMSALKNKSLFQVFLGIIIGSFVISLILFFCHGRRVRCLCLFESFESDRIYTESRYYPHEKKDLLVRTFVEDLVLGPYTNRYKFIFAAGTKVQFCYADGKTLYVGLSAEALKSNPETSDIKRGVELLRKNIVKNFTSFNKIYIFIDGVRVSGE